MSKSPAILTLFEHRDAGLEVAVICSAGHERVIDYHAENAKFGDIELGYEWRASQVCPICSSVGASTIIRQMPPDHV